METFSEMTGFNSTKIICTIGPATESEDMLRGLMENGMDVVRLNMSHGERAWHTETFARVRKVAEELGRHIGVIMDLQGPRIRVGDLEGGQAELKEGAECAITSEKVVGTAERFSTTYELLGGDCETGDRILIDDGLIELRVRAADGKQVECEVVHGGTLLPHKGMNLPGVNVSAPALSDKDLEDLEMGLELGVDFVALSFVRGPEDVHLLREQIDARGSGAHIISKLEKPEAIEKLGEIVDASHAVMVARGDLAVETAPEQVPVLQKRIIEACAAAHKPVIIATQMLDSMRENPTPTRAEASDVANAILDGADVVMMSGETAIGKFPLEATRMMRRIAVVAENALFEGTHLLTDWSRGQEFSFGEAVSRAAVEAAEEVGAKALIAFTQSGSTARRASKCRPSVPIIAATPLAETARCCSLYWGVAPILVGPARSTDEQIELVDARLQELGLLKRGEAVVITAGTPIGLRGTTNTMKLHVVGGGTR